MNEFDIAKHEIEFFAGFYCPLGTGYDWKSCEPGTYGTSTGLRSLEDCFPCDPGKFCDKFNATTYSGDCSERFFCRNGSSSKEPTGSDGNFRFPILFCFSTKVIIVRKI